MSVTITSAETFRRTVSALSETLKLIAQESAYPEHLRHHDKVARYEAHRDKLAKAARVYLEAGGSVQ